MTSRLSVVDPLISMEALPNHLCPLCGGANQCAPAQAGQLDVPCWCTKAVIHPQALKRIPAGLLNKACLCPRCASELDLPEAETGQPSAKP